MFLLLFALKSYFSTKVLKLIQAKAADTSNRRKSRFYMLNIYPTFDDSTTEKPAKNNRMYLFLEDKLGLYEWAGRM